MNAHRNTSQSFSLKGDFHADHNSKHSLKNTSINGLLASHFLSLEPKPPCPLNQPPQTPPLVGKTQPQGGAYSLFPRGDKPSTKTPWEVLESNRDLRNQIMESLHAGLTSCDEKEQQLLSGRIERMRACAEDATFYTDLATGRPRLSGQLCRCRTCPICAWRAELRNAKIWASRIGVFSEQHPTYRLLYLTLTIPPVLLTDLKPACQKLKTAFARLIKKFGHAYAGYFRLLELAPVIRNPDIEPPMQVRPHIHAIVVRRPKNGRTYVKAEAAEVAAAWTELTGFSDPLNVQLEPVKDAFGAVKYASKSPFGWKIREDFEYVTQLALAIHGLRLGSAGGVLRGITRKATEST